MNQKSNNVGTIYGVRLPKILHAVADNVKDKILIVGDVHGCFDELMELLNEVDYDPDKMTLVLVGDLCMKGPKTREVVEFCCRNRILSVRGNVDENTLRNYELKKGSAYQILSQLNHEELEYLYELPYTISIPCINSVIVHAGVVPGINIENQDLNDLIRMRTIRTQDGVLKAYSTEEDRSIQWINLYAGDQHIYFGHDARQGLQISDYATGLDTGCCYGKKLTGVLIDSIDSSRELFSVVAKEIYCPCKNVD